MAVSFRRSRRIYGIEYATGQPGQTDFELTTIEYIPHCSELSVYINGLLAYPGVDYEAVTSRLIRLTAPLEEEADLIFKVGS